MRTKGKIIFHIDINSFFASCEMALDPRLETVPFVVCNNHSKAVITTASYKARKYGVKSAMKLYQAQELCPNLVSKWSDMSLYSHYSQLFMEYLLTITPLVEPGSIDEAYMDVTDLSSKYHPQELAEKIQRELKEKLKLPVSIGIGPTKFLAKMASDMKKPLGITVIRKREIPEKIWPLNIRDVFGIGAKSEIVLNDIGIHTVKDLALADRDLIFRTLGNKHASSLLNSITGRSSNTVNPDAFVEIGAVGNSRTLFPSTNNLTEILSMIRYLCNSVSSRLKNRKSKGKVVQFGLGIENEKKITRQTTLDKYTDDFNDIYEVAYRFLHENWDDENIIFLGVSVAGVKFIKDISTEYTLFNYQEYDKIEDKKRQDEKEVEEFLKNKTEIYKS